MMRYTHLLAIVISVLPMAPAAVAQVDGSYLDTCRRVHQRGPVLHALCRTRDGDWTETTLDLRACRGGDIANRNGRLICVGGRGSRY